MPPTWLKSESCLSLHSFRRASCGSGAGSNTSKSSILSSERVGSPEAAHVGYNGHMRIAPGKVVNGRVELDVELPEGTSVTVLALEGDETFEVDAETEQMLLQAIEQCDKGQTTPMADLVSELRSRE
jgi:hypothetical protein